MSVICYDLTTGRIRQVTVTPGPAFESAQVGEPGEGVLRGQSLAEADVGAYFVDVTQSPVAVVARQANPASIDTTNIAADGVDVATVSGLPADTIVMVPGAAIPVVDGVFEFSVDAPGDYLITCRSIDHFDAVFEVTAA